MSKVCVVTGGGSGMGLSAAKFMPKDRIIVVSGRTESKLTKAVEQLREAGFEAYAKACDTSKRDSVKALAEYAASLGTITNVIHAAGVSPAMKGTMENILRINALGKSCRPCQRHNKNSRSLTLQKSIGKGCCHFEIFFMYLLYFLSSTNSNSSSTVT